MNPIVKVLIAATLSCLVLYYGISYLLGSTNELENSLDLKSLAHIRKDEGTSKAKPEIIVAPDEASARESVAAETPPERGDPADSVQAERVQPEADEPETDKTETDKTETAETDDESPDDSSAPADASGTRLKEVLNAVEPPPPVRAVDVAFEIPENCDVSDIVLAPLSVKYRYESPTIKGDSIGELQLFAAEYHRCEGGILRLSHNPLGKEDSSPMLMQRRLDEIKYFFLQHRVPKSALRFPDNS